MTGEPNERQVLAVVEILKTRFPNLASVEMLQLAFEIVRAVLEGVDSG